MATPAPYVGEIRQFAGHFPPEGWALCNGQPVSVADNPDLYRLLGTTYGGDGVNFINLPDLQGRVPVHMSGQYVPGQRGGSESVVLQPGQLPAHTHAVNVASSGGIDDPKGNFWGSSASKPYSAPPGNLRMNYRALQSAGGGEAHENRIPFQAITYIIALKGIFPNPG